MNSVSSVDPDVNHRPDFWLGERGEYVVTDFDGRLRACYVLGGLERPPSEAEPNGRRYFLVRVDPPLRTEQPLPPVPGGETAELVLSERHRVDNLDELVEGWLSVNVQTVRSPQAFLTGDLQAAGLSLFAWGMVARTPSQLPPSQEQSFARSLALLKQFAAREGHADVPLKHAEGGTFLGSFVSNLRSAKAYGHLREDWAEALESVPGWQWLPGDDVFLIEQFARREGHTDVPLDHVEEGRPLGRWVCEMRASHAKGGNWKLAPHVERRLEAIRRWHW